MALRVCPAMKKAHTNLIAVECCSLTKTGTAATVPPSSDEGPMNITTATTPPLLSLQDLWMAYGNLDVLKGVSLDVAEGELAFVIGPSGSGKSTLLRCCNRLEEPRKGRIFLGQDEITAPRTNLNALRRQIGMVFQQFNLYPHLNARANVTLALRKVLGKSRTDANEIAMAALKRVGLQDKADSFPNELSGGQQQRVAIARGLALEPRVMLFDEPTSALDPELVGDVLNVMRELKDSGMTMVVVSHEMRFAQRAADTVIFMDQGVVVESGSPAQIFDDPRHQRTRDFVSMVEH